YSQSGPASKEKKFGKGKQKTTELENISEADLTKTEQLKIITKRSRQETHSSHASGSGADEGTGVIPGVPDAPNYDLEDDISWKSSDDDQDDEQAQDDEDIGKNDVNETTQDDEDDDDHDDDEKVQDDDEHDVDETVQEDDDEELAESDDDGDDFVHPKLTTHDDEKRKIVDKDVEGANVAGAKSDEDATDEKDQGNEAVKDTNTDLDGRDKVMTDVDDTHVTLTPTSVNPDVNNKVRLNQWTLQSKLKYERIREESSTANQQFLESIDDGMKKIIKEQEANPSHVLASNLFRIELKKILIDKMDANISINRSEHSETAQQVIIKRLEMVQMMIKNPPLEQTRGPKEEGQVRNPLLPVLQVKRQPRVHERLPVQELRLTHVDLLANSASSRGCYHSTDFLKGPADQEFRNRLKLSNGMIISILTGLQYEGMMMFSTSSKKGNFHRLRIQDIEDMLLLLVQGKSD
ncbi:hypothetical protein Tco_0837576, partial [Tanacetum coccineum]